MNWWHWRSINILMLLILAFTLNVDGRKYMRCELSRELLQKYLINKTFLSNWVCMIEHESGCDTGKVTKQPNGSSAYGIFQIDDKQYCRMGRKGGYCNKKCEDFTNDNIDDDVECAKLIFQREGFKYWRGWKLFCKNPQNLPNLSIACNIHTLQSVTSNGFFRTFRIYFNR